MNVENREAERFQDFTRVEAKKISKLPGILQDLSRTGCRIKFSHVEVVDINSEFAITITPSPEYKMNEFEIIAKPVWTAESTDSCKIGFAVLNSVGTREYLRYIEKLANAKKY